MNTIPKHKVFISFHHKDEDYKDKFVGMMGDDIIDKSVKDGDIDNMQSSTETIRQKIRERFIGDAVVTAVLIGPCTWRRKHVDWEIGSSLRDTRSNPRCGLLGILLPNHKNYNHEYYGESKFNPNLIPPRLADNCGGMDPFARIYDWSNNPESIRRWIHQAFERKSRTPPNNSRPPFGQNRGGEYSKGWTY